MSTASLRSDVPLLYGTPAYTEEPQECEQRLALGERVRHRPSGNFIKQSRNGGVKLCLTAQEANVDSPVYGSGAHVEGTVELTKTGGVTSVEVKIEGRLRMQEIAEGGGSSVKFCLDSSLLWVRANNDCPSTHKFRLNLPPNFTWEGKTYPLPPTYAVKLSGIPGFNASIEYSVSATVNRPNSFPPLVPRVRSSLLGSNGGSITVSTPFVYHPRTRSAVPLPPGLTPSRDGFQDSPDWRKEESVIRFKSYKGYSGQDILVRFYIPSSRIFCMSQPIPFHLTFLSSAHSLAAFLPFSPTSRAFGKRSTRVQVMRQATVDVRNEEILGTKTDMWRVDGIGEATFRLVGDAPAWISYSGEIVIDDSVKIAGFKAGGLSVRDCILLSFNPPDPKKCPFEEARHVVSIRLATDPFVHDSNRSRTGSEYSVPSSPSSNS